MIPKVIAVANAMAKAAQSVVLFYFTTLMVGDLLAVLEMCSASFVTVI